MGPCVSVGSMPLPQPPPSVEWPWLVPKFLCWCHRYKILLLALLAGSAPRRQAESLPPFPRRSPTASRRAMESPHSPPAPPTDKTPRRRRTSAARSSPPPLRPTFSPPHLPPPPP